MTTRIRPVSLPLLAALLATPAAAHHRQTPAVLRYTSAGDHALPRVPALGRTTIVLGLPAGGDTAVATLKPYRKQSGLATVVATGDNQNPAISYSGAVVAFDTDADPLGSGLPGRQIVVSKRGTLLQATDDPSGTSVNPTLDVGGAQLAFESTGDLAGTGNAGVRQIFLSQPTGQMIQVSAGLGTSRNPVLSPRKRWIAFQSTSDPMLGVDTGIDQIWFGSVVGAPAPAPITSGLAPSTSPAFSDDGQFLAFQSRASLVGDLSDLGVPQIFVYHVKTGTYAQLTSEATGCTDPAVGKVKRDWRVTYVCNGVGYFYLLRDDTRHQVQTPDGDTTRVVPELGTHFVVVATTADLLAGSGTTAGHQIYQINLFKRPADVLSGGFEAIWYPFRGVRARR